MSTKSGLVYAEQHLTITRVPPSCALWVPFGVIAWPIALEPLEDRKKASGKAEASPTVYGEAVVVSPAIASFASQCDAMALKAIVEMTGSYLERLAAKKAWRARHEFVLEFKGMLSQQPLPPGASASS